MQNPKPEFLDKWKITKKIGGGGFGEIYAAKIIDTEEPVAIKVESSKQSKQVTYLKIKTKVVFLECQKRETTLRATDSSYRQTVFCML